MVTRVRSAMEVADELYDRMRKLNPRKSRLIDEL